MTCNDLKVMYDGRCQYNALTNERGGLVDDIIIYRYNPEKYLLCVNASNSDKDFQWLSSHNRFDCSIVNKSADYGQLALQGPRAGNVLRRVCGDAPLSLKSYHFMECTVEGTLLIVARTGYTGEDGFELFVPWQKSVWLWQKLMSAGAADGIKPIGLGARDSLRLESSYSLYGHELGDDISAIESGLAWIVKCEKGPFCGSEVICSHKTKGAPRSLVGFFVDEPGIVRNPDKIFSTDGKEIGYVTSGTRSPTLEKSLGMALVDSRYAAIDTPIYAEVRGRKLKCHVVKKPFYKRPVNA